jgi:hypothetical protein
LVVDDGMKRLQLVVHVDVSTGAVDLLRIFDGDKLLGAVELEELTRALKVRKLRFEGRLRSSWLRWVGWIVLVGWILVADHGGELLARWSAG